MSLSRFGNVAFDWNRVYAAKILKRDFNERPEAIAVFLDIRGQAVGKQSLEVAGSGAADRFWKQLLADERFTVFKNCKNLAFDLSTVASIVRNGETGESAITFCLDKDRSGALELHPDAAYAILEAIGESGAGGA